MVVAVALAALVALAVLVAVLGMTAGVVVVAVAAAAWPPCYPNRRLQWVAPTFCYKETKGF